MPCGPSGAALLPSGAAVVVLHLLEGVVDAGEFIPIGEGAYWYEDAGPSSARAV